MVSHSPVIIWFRRDLRLADNPALTEASHGERKVIPVYIDETDTPRPDGSAQRWWLHHSLNSLKRSLAAKGAPLILRKGQPDQILPELALETGAKQVMWNRRYDPLLACHDRNVQKSLLDRHIHVATFEGNLLFDPSQIQTVNGGVFQRFAPFWRHCMGAMDPSRPLAAPERLFSIDTPPSLSQDWDLPESLTDCPHFLDGVWSPGEDAARARLVDFLDSGLAQYEKKCRNLPDYGTSRLSPHLAFGELSVRQIWHGCGKNRLLENNAFLRELGQREFFAHMLLTRIKKEGEKNCQPRISPPEGDAKLVWMRFITGVTGYPIIDAGMRSLMETGWMHHSLRLIVASFLLNDLRLPWELGEAWFAECLVDAEPSSNIGNWRRIAGLDDDPITIPTDPLATGEKFDPHGRFIRRWVPELADLPGRAVHYPWLASSDLLAKGGVTLGKDYPQPLQIPKV